MISVVIGGAHQGAVHGHASRGVVGREQNNRLGKD